MTIKEEILKLLEDEKWIDAAELVTTFSKKFNELDVRRTIWNLTSEGVLEFDPGFKKLRKQPIFEKQLKEIGLGKPKEFNPSILVDVDNKRICIILEDVSHYSEWIREEDGDISIYKANDDSRVVGAFLPLRVWKGQFSLDII